MKASVISHPQWNLARRSHVFVFFFVFRVFTDVLQETKSQVNRSWIGQASGLSAGEVIVATVGKHAENLERVKQAYLRKGLLLVDGELERYHCRVVAD
ncbi:hypothetical protein FN846DRAFT_970788 [Sphaerosporella brunnea]|uniref:Uncharacterized protein n=1 Tax=Sphaerosporella brunnea TaxID=1250544 RepID=A0A5J5EKG6_9PEZI|nr:hypothetical protein FN846DRAFT_970788 [Sphaerosporella brunnea]